jgi:hypothetical protein
MLKVGTAKTLKTLECAASKRRKARCRRKRWLCARRWRRLFDTARRRGQNCREEVDLRHGGKLERGRRRNQPAPEKSCGDGACGEIFPAVGASRACEKMPRAAADASHMAPPIGQNAAHTKSFTTPSRIAHPLEDNIRIRTLHTGGYYSTGAG